MVANARATADVAASPLTDTTLRDTLDVTADRSLQEKGELGSDQAKDERQYFIWGARGSPRGGAQSHWLAARGGGARVPGPNTWMMKKKVGTGRPDAQFPRLADQRCAGWVTSLLDRSLGSTTAHRRAEARTRGWKMTPISLGAAFSQHD